MTKRTHATKPSTDYILNLRIPRDLDAKASEVATKVSLKKSDTMRLALERGLDVLVDQLKPASAA